MVFLSAICERAACGKIFSERRYSVHDLDDLVARSLIRWQEISHHVQVYQRKS